MITSCNYCSLLIFPFYLSVAPLLFSSHHHVELLQFVYSPILYIGGTTAVLQSPGISCEVQAIFIILCISLFPCSSIWLLISDHILVPFIIVSFIVFMTSSIMISSAVLCYFRCGLIAVIFFRLIPQQIYEVFFSPYPHLRVFILCPLCSLYGCSSPFSRVL